METTKYGKYIVEAPNVSKSEIHPNMFGQVGINNELNGTMPGAFYLSCALVLKKDEIGPRNKPHNHDFNEYLVFLGTNPEDPQDLGGEVELWLENEKHLITKSAAVFVPQGLYHTPLIFKRVDKPMILIRVGNALKDSHLSYSQDPRWASLPDEPIPLPE
jgi:hypothetical protein